MWHLVFGLHSKACWANCKTRRVKRTYIILSICFLTLIVLEEDSIEFCMTLLSGLVSGKYYHSIYTSFMPVLRTRILLKPWSIELRGYYHPCKLISKSWHAHFSWLVLWIYLLSFLLDQVIKSHKSYEEDLKVLWISCVITWQRMTKP